MFAIHLIFSSKNKQPQLFVSGKNEFQELLFLGAATCYACFIVFDTQKLLNSNNGAIAAYHCRSRSRRPGNKNQ